MSVASSSSAAALPVSVPDLVSWVHAAPFRAKFKDLVFDSGLPWRALAHAIRLPAGVARSLLFGRDGRQVTKIRWVDASRIMTADLEAIRQLDRQPAARDELQLAITLLAAELSEAQLCAELRISPSQLCRLRAGRGWATRMTEILAIAACESRGIELEEWRRSLPTWRAA